MILAGDIGGTKTLLALYTYRENETVCIKKEQFASNQYASFEELLTVFLEDRKQESISAACIGVAGIVINHRCETTNLPWVLSVETISQLIHTHKVWLLNDLEATAWGLLNLPAENFMDLNPDAQYRKGNIAVLAAGTGLGEAIVAWNGIDYHVIATEGGHSDFSPNNEREIALLRYLQQKHPNHVSNERVISGEGLINLYQFLKESPSATPNKEIEQQMVERDPAAVIGEAGIAGTDDLAVEALNWFCRLYGAESGNLALKCLPYGGVYLAGGIASKILPCLQQGGFMQGFLAKGRCQSILQSIPVKVCNNPEVALLGALSHAIANHTLG